MAAGLRRVIAKTKEDWNEVDVLRALNAQTAQLFVDPDGFAVIQPLRDEWTGLPYVNVWAAYFKPGKAKASRARLVGWLDELTGRNWKFNSPRLGWGALDEMEIERVVYRRKKK